MATALEQKIVELQSEKASPRKPITEQQLRRLQPMEPRNSATGRVVENYVNNVLAAPAEHRRQGMHRADIRLREMWRRDMFQINGEHGVDLNEFMGAVMQTAGGRNGGPGMDARLYEAMRFIRDDDKWNHPDPAERQRIREFSVDAVGGSQWARYLETVVRLGTIELCSGPDIAPILSLFGRINVGCEQRTLASDPVEVDIAAELGPSAEGEPTPSFGLGDPVEIDIQKRQLIKFYYALYRSSLCFNLNDTLRRIMSQGASRLDRYWAPQIITLLFDVHDVTSYTNPWPFTLDQVKWRTYYQEQATEGAVPYENLIYNENDITGGDESLFIAVEQLFDRMTDFRHGEPVVCTDEYQIVATGRRQAEVIEQGLSDQMKVRDLTNNVGDGQVRFDRPRRDRWGRPQWSLWMQHYLHPLLEAAYGATYTRAERQQMIDRWFVAGNVSQAFAITVEWQREEMDMPVDMVNFEKEVIWGRKFMEKSGLAVIQPQAVVNVHGWADTAGGGGNAVPTPDPSPIS